MTDLDDVAEDIIEIYSRELNDEEQFHHALEELSKHPPKVSKLFESEEETHLKEEIVDVLLLSHVLKLKKDISTEDIDSAAQHFIKKIDEIYED
jgi:hypothetical protein